MEARLPARLPYVHPVRTGYQCRTTQVSAWDLDPSLRSPPQMCSTSAQVTTEELEPVVERETPWQERDFSIPASVWEATLGRAVARHVRLPRSAKSGVAGSQHPRFIVENSPLELVRLKCESAGMVPCRSPPPQPHATATRRHHGDRRTRCTRGSRSGR